MVLNLNDVDLIFLAGAATSGSTAASSASTGSAPSSSGTAVTSQLTATTTHSYLKRGSMLDSNEINGRLQFLHSIDFFFLLQSSLF